MDFDFIYDRSTRVYSVVCDNEFMALSRFINEELVTSPQLETFLTWLRDNKQAKQTFTEWHIELDEEEVSVTFNQLLQQIPQETDIDEEQTTLDWESQCNLGKQDLIKLLTSYLKFRV